MGNPEQNISKKPNRRRKYVTDPAFQWKYALTATSTVFIISCVASTVIFGVLHQQARMRTMFPGGPSGTNLTMVMLLTALVFAALTAGGVCLWWMVITNRLCGPLSKIGEWLNELGTGRFPSLRALRQKDEFKGFYAIFRKTVESLKARKESELEQLTSLLHDVRSAAGGNEQTVRSTLKNVEEHLEAWRRETSTSLGNECHGESESAQHSAARQLAKV